MRLWVFEQDIQQLTKNFYLLEIQLFTPQNLDRRLNFIETVLYFYFTIE